jgi:tRNA (adenine57-N1/adenine58-N1)-methyltransferase catalytic subunit
MKALITKKGKIFFHRKGDMHTQFGFIKEEILAKSKPGDILTTNTGKTMSVLDIGFMDKYKKIKRGAQIIPLKDIGHIIAETGLNKKSIVLESGSGSGATTTFIANIVKKVITYEIREDFYKIVKHNIDFLEMKNIKQNLGDIYEGIKEKNVDVIILDLPEPWKVIPHAKKALKNGGYLVSYSPSIPQVSDFVEEIKKADEFIFLKTTETIQRDWEIEGRKIRPKSQAIGHSGFITFARKI